MKKSKVAFRSVQFYPTHALADFITSSGSLFIRFNKCFELKKPMLEKLEDFAEFGDSLAKGMSTLPSL